MLVASVSFKYVAGADVDLEFTVTDEDDAVVNLSGASVEFIARRDLADDPALSTSDSTATASFTDQANGVFVVSLSSANTAELSGTYRFQALVQDSFDNVHVVARGYITFVPSLLSSAS